MPQSNHFNGIAVVLSALLAFGYDAAAAGVAGALHHHNGCNSNNVNTIEGDRRVHARHEQKHRDLSVESRITQPIPTRMHSDRFRIDLMVRGGSDGSFAYGTDSQSAAIGGTEAGIDDIIPPPPSLPLDQQPFQERIDAWKRYQQVRATARYQYHAPVARSLGRAI